MSLRQHGCGARPAGVLFLLSAALAAGCRCTGACPLPPDGPDLPRELTKMAMPPYKIETPDILLIDALRVTPLPPYHIQPLDQVFIQVPEPLPGEPITGVYSIDPDGSVNLGPSYGSVRLIDLTIEEARSVLEQRLRQKLKKPAVTVSLAQSRAVQQIRGEHLVRPDGTVSLGTYGSVFVGGLTISQAKAAVEQHLSRYLFRPEVAIDVFAYNSKYYYVITDGAGYGEQVVRVPATGNETVLDALSQINGLPPVASKQRIWVARPAPAGAPPQIFPVDWRAITTGAETATNYQIFPGDRIYVKAQPVIAADTALARLLAPVERVFGVVLLGSGTVNSLRTNPNGNNTTTTTTGR